MGGKEGGKEKREGGRERGGKRKRKKLVVLLSKCLQWQGLSQAKFRS